MGQTMNHIQKEGFLHLFNRSGNVLDFNTSGFNRFTQESVGVPLCEKYGLSKGKSLESFCQEAPEDDVEKLFTDLLEYYEFTIKGSPKEKEYIPLYEKCKEVITIEKLKGTPNMSINKLPSNSEQLLNELLSAKNPSSYLCDKYKSAPHQEKEVLRGIIKELVDEGYINVSWYDNLPAIVSLNNSARTYEEMVSTTTSGGIPRTINNYYGNTNFFNAPLEGSLVITGDNNKIEFSYEKATDAISEIESAMNEESITADDKETAIEMLNEIREKITQQKKPSFIKSALVGLKDFLIGVGASATVAVVQAKMQGMF